MWALGALFVAGCAETEKATTDSGLVKSNFQTEVGGKKTDLYVLRNQNNMEVCVTNFGGRIVSVMVPDKEGVMRDVVLGFDSIQDYISKPSDFGASIGRYANRINQGKFTLDGVEYQLPRNNYGHCLHGDIRCQKTEDQRTGEHHNGTGAAHENGTHGGTDVTETFCSFKFSGTDVASNQCGCSHTKTIAGHVAQTFCGDGERICRN